LTFSTRRRVAATAALGVLTFTSVVGLGGCSATALPSAGEVPSSTAGQSSAPVEPSEVPSAREGRPARSERVTFIPEEVELPGRAHAAVEPASTVDGVLMVPENVRHVGWWDGSASAGDPFGSTVIAGHVDSATEGLGFFARLRRTEIGDHVTVRAGAHHQTYRVVAVTSVAKQALASDSRAFDQTSAHRLVLITCTGNFRRDRGGYDSNLVVIAKPIGRAR
jgi:LPXTG-site transpeptidase (sortase) family protein